MNVVYECLDREGLDRECHDLQRCENCETFSHCKKCGATETDRQRHNYFCEKIGKQRTKYEEFKIEAILAGQTRPGVYVDLADSAYTLVDMMLQAIGTNEVPIGTANSMVNWLENVRNRGFWNDRSFKLMTPPLYIRQKKDQKAYDILMWFLTHSYDSETRGLLGKHPFDNASKNHQFSILENVGDHGVCADNPEFWIFCVPLILIKLRLLFDLRYLKQNPRAYESWCAMTPRTRLRRDGPGRSQMSSLRNRDNLDGHISSLENEIKDLAQFSETRGQYGQFWGHFWEHMLYAPDGAFRDQDGPINMLIRANYHSWLDTPGAFEEMKMWRFLELGNAAPRH